jgi:hypothetical protein
MSGLCFGGPTHLHVVRKYPVPQESLAGPMEEAMLKIGWKRCPFCSREDLYISHPKSLWEEVGIAVLLQPVRCHDCMRRFFRPLFTSPRPKILVERRRTAGVNTESSVAVANKKRAA